MKKLSLFIAGLFLLLFSLGANAQAKAPADYFTGKWNIVVEGTPQGDGKMFVILERKDGKLDGTILPKQGADTVKISKIEETEKSVTLYFNTNGYDINLKLEKKDDDHVTGNLMDMFDAKGERVKEIASKQ